MAGVTVCCACAAVIGVASDLAWGDGLSEFLQPISAVYRASAKTGHKVPLYNMQSARWDALRIW